MDLIEFQQSHKLAHLFLPVSQTFFLPSINNAVILQSTKTNSPSENFS